MRDKEDEDWGTGSADYAEAAKMVREWRAAGDDEAYIAVIETTINDRGDVDGICVEEIHDDFDEAE